MNARKVLEMGGSFLVSIPKDWAKRNGVSNGDTVVVEELSERKLVVRPIQPTEGAPKEVEVEYPREDLTYVINDVTGAYLLGYDIIRGPGPHGDDKGGPREAEVNHRSPHWARDNRRGLQEDHFAVPTGTHRADPGEDRKADDGDNRGYDQ